MPAKNISVTDDNLSVWESAKHKAGPIALSKVIIQLLKMWIADRIKIDWGL